MKCRVNLCVEMVLSEQEARWLMGRLQNRDSVQAPDFKEAKVDSDMRDSLFGELRNAFDEAGE